MIHMSPTTNYVDHGFYMFSPTLFYDFYEANGWTIRQIRLIRHTQEHDTATYWSLDYSPDHFARLSFGGLGEGLYQTFVVVEKAPGATATRIPQQRAYREGSWRAASVSGGNSDESVALRIRERLAHVGPWITALQAANGGNLDVAIFGGGRHTAILLPLWRERNLPEPRWIVQSAPPDSSECCGLPVMTVDELARVRTPQLLVLSSQMFEGQMAQAVARTFPAVPMVRFWS